MRKTIKNLEPPGDKVGDPYTRYIYPTGACEHKWKTLEIRYSQEYGGGITFIRTYFAIQECEKCGYMRTKEVENHS